MARRNFGFDLEGIENLMGNHLRLFVTFTLGLLLFVGLIALSVFFVFVQGKEEVMVPNVLGKGLVEALVELQDKELYPRITLRSAAAGEEKGIILEQNPDAGTLVKAERRISLVVSQGMALDRIGNFVGSNINDVRMEIHNFNLQSPETTITIREPFMYIYSDVSAGLVLQQNPSAGTDLTGPTLLDLVVSRGREDIRITVPDLSGLTFTDAIARLSQLRVGFNFSIRNNAENPGIVYAQRPAGGATVGSDGNINVSVNIPAAEAGEATGLFSYNLPVNPYPLPLIVEAELPNGNRQILASTNHSGGEFSIPYKLPAGSVIILYMVDREIFRQPAGVLVESFTIDE